MGKGRLSPNHRKGRGNVEINQELLILHRRTGGSAYYKLGCTIKLNVSRHSEIKTGNPDPCWAGSELFHVHACCRRGILIWRIRLYCFSAFSLCCAVAMGGNIREPKSRFGSWPLFPSWLKEGKCNPTTGSCGHRGTTDRFLKLPWPAPHNQNVMR